MEISTCLHDITDKIKYNVRIKDFNRTFEDNNENRCILDAIVCEKCYDKYKKQGVILETKEQEEQWLQKQEQN